MGVISGAGFMIVLRDPGSLLSLVDQTPQHHNPTTPKSLLGGRAERKECNLRFFISHRTGIVEPHNINSGQANQQN